MPMSFEAILAGLGVAIVVIAYVTRPFREASDQDTFDGAIEAWIMELRADAGALEPGGDDRGTETMRQVECESASPEGGVINCCSQCGRPVASKDRYCSGCGYRLGGDDG